MNIENMTPSEILIWVVSASLVITQVLAVLKARGIDLRRLCSENHDLHVWHDKDDPQGRKMWYNNYELPAAINRLSKAIEKMGDILNTLLKNQERIEMKVDLALKEKT